MPKRRHILILLTCGLAVGLYALLSAPREPSFQGRLLSEWLEEDANRYYVNGSRPFDEAMNHMGTNVLPCFLKWIRYQSPPWKTNVYAVLNPALRSLNKDWVLFDRQDLRADRVWRAFKVLGPKAKAALPELTRIVGDPKSGVAQRRAAYAMGYLGKDAVPPLLEVLTNRQAKARSYAAFAIRDLGTNALPAVPGLVACLRDQDAACASTAAETLGRLKLEPSVVVPALVQTLGDSRQRLRIAVMQALSNFAGEAAPAVARLLLCLGDQDTFVASDAADVLGRLSLDPNRVVPALSNSLHDPRPRVRWAAVGGIARFVPESPLALPALQVASSDPDPEVQNGATNFQSMVSRQKITNAPPSTNAPPK